ncbi:hypothetical protein SEVIR_1G105800v4 [Setaria viridis]|uniref:NADP-dependent oxidoreductase domain-containing protein n=1 Tax=Setaria viridis TaxID=4556 RepID=A0A4U6W786_SETVI|nr:NADP-dependent D-sorbitol-6-phosphate dehydrogenase-like [Setaria viridis]TKW38301.1 hypothetical protein SEVIR_1G105800v2 [Setaria viridis]
MAAKDVAPAVTLSNGHHGGGMPAATKLSNGHSMKTVPAVTLSSGHRMPAVGLGVWRMEKTAMRGIIHAAIRKGYRHFDCAAKYQNEAEVGDALEEAFETGLVKREDLFITTKLWNSDHGHVIEACKDSLKKLKLDYLDLYLVHFPVATRHTEVGSLASVIGEDGVLDIDTTVSLEATWHAMEDLVNMGLVRSIGISNYGVFLTRDCLAYAKIKPAVNQIEMHPYFQRDSLVKFCQKHGICVTAHTPLGGSTANAELFGSLPGLDDPVIKELAEKYGKTPAQLVLRWGLQKNTVVIPKTSKVERLQENLEVFDFDISDEDMEEMKAIDKNHRTNQPAKFWGIDVYS